MWTGLLLSAQSRPAAQSGPAGTVEPPHLQHSPAALQCSTLPHPLGPREDAEQEESLQAVKDDKAEDENLLDVRVVVGEHDEDSEDPCDAQHSEDSQVDEEV